MLTQATPRQTSPTAPAPLSPPATESTPAAQTSIQASRRSRSTSGRASGLVDPPTPTASAPPAGIEAMRGGKKVDGESLQRP